MKKKPIIYDAMVLDYFFLKNHECVVEKLTFDLPWTCRGVLKILGKDAFDQSDDFSKGDKVFFDIRDVSVALIKERCAIINDNCLMKEKV